MNLLLFAFLIFRPIPLSGVITFLLQDSTDLNQYTQNYNCTNFAYDLSMNAKIQGIEAEPIAILFTHEIGHEIVAFHTTDAGIVYVEPQSNTIYSNVIIGNRLCSADMNLCVGEEPIRRIIIDK